MNRLYTVSLVSLAFLTVGLWYLMSVPVAQAVGPWPSNSQWIMLTSGGSLITDREARASCTDPRNGGTSPSQANDIGSQAKCSGGTKYNPGLIDTEFGTGTQPSAVLSNTYSTGTYYSDPNGDSNACFNISDDIIYFRVRLAASPLQANPAQGLTNNYWWATLDVDADGIIDFYVRVNGNQGISGGDPSTTENIQLFYETSNDADPTGEPIVATHLNPLNTGYARAAATPDNGTVGDATEYFLDWQLPVSDFKDDLGVQSLVLCEGAAILLTNYSTSENGNDPFQKDRIMALGTFSDVIIQSTPEYEITKTATDVNGGALLVGDEVEYTITASNLAANLSNFVFTDPIPTGGTYVPGSIKVTLDATTYTMTDANDSPDAGGCPAATNCIADYNVTTVGAVTVKNDWLYSMTAASPLYDEFIIKFRVTFASLGTKSNQGRGVMRELPNNLLTDDPAVDNGSDCVTASTDNCNDGITDNDDPTQVTVVTPPPEADLSVTKTDGIGTVIPGSSIVYSIVVTNNGPTAVVGATVTDTFDASLSNVSWVCVASGGSSCTGAGLGDINDTAVDLLSSGTATYTVNADTDPDASGSLINTATATTPGGILDPTSGNDSATDTDTYTPTDFGDAPDPTFPTLLASSGASHTIVSGEYLGASVDQEPDGQPNATATGDDIADTDDEDGVSFTSSIIQGATADVTVTASVAGLLNSLIDFTADGGWDDAGEQIFTDEALFSGANNLTFL